MKSLAINGKVDSLNNTQLIIWFEELRSLCFDERFSVVVVAAIAFVIVYLWTMHTQVSAKMVLTLFLLNLS